MANLKPFQDFGSRLSLCLMARERDRLRAEAEGQRKRHRREHVRGVVFLVDGLVADHRPAGGLDDVDIETVL
jgi:hypothetical protein